MHKTKVIALVNRSETLYVYTNLYDLSIHCLECYLVLLCFLSLDYDILLFF